MALPPPPQLQLSIQLSVNHLALCTAHTGKIQQLRIHTLPDNRPWSAAAQSILEQEEIAQYPADRISVILDTDRVCLIPTACYRRQDVQNYLHLHGISWSTQESPITTPPHDDKVALMCLSSTLHTFLQELYRDRLHYTHPLLLLHASDKALLEVSLTHDFVHLTARNGTLLFAETLPRRNEADLLYYIQLLHNSYPQIRFRTLVSGTDAPQIHRAITRYFKHTHLFRPTINRTLTGSTCACTFTHLIRSIHAHH